MNHRLVASVASLQNRCVRVSLLDSKIPTTRAFSSKTTSDWGRENIRTRPTHAVDIGRDAQLLLRHPRNGVRGRRWPGQRLPEASRCLPCAGVCEKSPKAPRGRLGYPTFICGNENQGLCDLVGLADQHADGSPRVANLHRQKSPCRLRLRSDSSKKILV